MSDPAPDAAIHLEGVTVRYRVPSERIGTFKEYMIRWLQRRITHHHFLALNDVNLEIRRGEFFGLIGRNGAGKSTLLKVVSRVLVPTEGRVVVRGTVAPLLELGAGFHPELNGYENIFLNGALLGHTNREIQARVGEIAAFSELGDFLQAPLRTYSTGMTARLGFAVATAWRPEILILDEIMAVGDEGFQKKCRTRMESFRSEGTTILMVSHATSVLAEECERIAWVDAGRIRAMGEARAVVDEYHRA